MSQTTEPRKLNHVRRTNRPSPNNCTKQTFPRIFAVDGSTLEALFRKLDALKDTPPGRMAATTFRFT